MIKTDLHMYKIYNLKIHVVKDQVIGKSFGILHVCVYLSVYAVTI